MASIYDLKPKFQNILRPLSNWLAFRGITANEVTISAIVLSALAGIVIACFPTAQFPMLLVPIILLLRMMLNAIDGMLAREYNMQTALGTFLNELGDVLSDTFIYLPFCLVPNVSSMLIISIVILAIISEMMGVVAIQVGTTRRYEGPMGKSDRVFVFGAIGLLLGLGFKAGAWLNITLGLTILALILTIIKRVTNALKEAPNNA